LKGVAQPAGGKSRLRYKIKSEFGAGGGSDAAFSRRMQRMLRLTRKRMATARGTMNYYTRAPARKGGSTIHTGEKVVARRATSRD